MAFLRAINVGGRTVKMDRLRKCFQSMGLDKVETFIASGNVVFESPIAATRALEHQIANELRDALGYDVATFIRTPAEVAAAARYQAFPAFVDAFTLSVGLLPDKPSAAARQALAGCHTETDDFCMHGRELYWLCRTRVSESSVTGKQLERAIGMPFTMRNITTLRRLSAKYPSEP